MKFNRKQILAETRGVRKEILPKAGSPVWCHWMQLASEGRIKGEWQDYPNRTLDQIIFDFDCNQMLTDPLTEEEICNFKNYGSFVSPNQPWKNTFQQWWTEYQTQDETVDNDRDAMLAELAYLAGYEQGKIDRQASLEA
jgi:hypothetical protein